MSNETLAQLAEEIAALGGVDGAAADLAREAPTRSCGPNSYYGDLPGLPLGAHVTADGREGVVVGWDSPMGPMEPFYHVLLEGDELGEPRYFYREELRG